ncbi:MAG: TrmH family RNA methyltransferase [Flavobacterium sp.]
MSAQLTHSEFRFKEREFPIIVVCDHIYFQQNIGSLFRICEAFGVEKIYFIGEKIALTPRKINKTSRSTHLRVKHEVINDKHQIISFLKNNNFDIISLEITDDSVNIRDFKINPEKPLALILGNEIEGISSDLLEISNQIVHIEMFGKNSSMNVVQAASITLYEIVNQLKAIIK